MKNAIKILKRISLKLLYKNLIFLSLNIIDAKLKKYNEEFKDITPKFYVF